MTQALGGFLKDVLQRVHRGEASTHLAEDPLPRIAKIARRTVREL
jgi:hypothetical protein